MSKNSFYHKCYLIIEKVPKGKIIIYKQIANKLNSKAYQAVGSAMNNNPHDENKVPCHRVIRSNLCVGDYVGGVEEKIKKLRKEGVEIEINENDLKKSKIINFEKIIHY